MKKDGHFVTIIVIIVILLVLLMIPVVSWLKGNSTGRYVEYSCTDTCKIVKQQALAAASYRQTECKAQINKQLDYCLSEVERFQQTCLSVEDPAAKERCLANVEESRANCQNQAMGGFSTCTATFEKSVFAADMAYQNCLATCAG